MRKIIVALSLFLVSWSYAQQEIKLDIADALVLKTLDISYEFYLNDNTSVGLAALFNFEGRSSDFRYNEDQMITPFFRHYFKSESDWNFFGELFLGINLGEEENTSGTTVTYADYTDAALGVGIGTKYISEGGFTIDIHGGLGRNLFGSNSPVIVPRVGVGLGYQF